MNKYVKILLDKEYQDIMGFSEEDCKREISRLYELRVHSQAHDEIVKGKRRPKPNRIIMSITGQMDEL